MSRVEMVAMFGVSKQRVSQLVRCADFPAPVATLGIGPVWEREAVEAWMRATGRIDEDQP